jgi:hypothetical protein
MSPSDSPLSGTPLYSREDAFRPDDEAFAVAVESGALLPYTEVTLRLPTPIVEALRRAEAFREEIGIEALDLPKALARRLTSPPLDIREDLVALKKGFEPFLMAPFSVEGSAADVRYRAVIEAVAVYLEDCGWDRTPRELREKADDILTRAVRDRARG